MNYNRHSSLITILAVTLSLAGPGCISAGNKDQHELDMLASNVTERVSMDLPNVQEKIDESEGCGSNHDGFYLRSVG